MKIKEFLALCAKENQISDEIVEKIFEQSIKVAAARYYPQEFVNSLHYDRQSGEIVDDNGNIVSIKDKFGLGGIKLLKDHFLQEIKKHCVENEIKNLMDSKSKLVIAKVTGKDKNNVFLSYKTLELVMPKEEQILGEEYKVGDIYKVVVIHIENVKGQYNVIVSRSSEMLLVELLAMEVPELKDNKVSIVSLVREAGYRSKVVVKANVPDIDVIGVFMGLRNARISNVSRELNGEKIDVIEWKDDIKEFIKASLKPARIINVTLIENDRKAIVETLEEDIGVCVGKNGQNIRLASRLCGWYIEVKK